LASDEPALLSAVEPVLVQSGAKVEIVFSPAAVEAALTAPGGPDAAPDLVLLDARLPGLDLNRVLAVVRPDAASRLPIVLFSDTVFEDLKNRLDEGIVDDLLPTTVSAGQLLVRLNLVERARRREREIESLRDALARSDRIDRLTGAYTRDAILSLLFRETDRVQRMNTALCLVLFDIDDFGHWNAHLGCGPCDRLLMQVTERVGRLLRSYDLLGRVGKDEFLAALPGCSAVNAVLLAERIRAEVFAAPFPVANTAVRLTACFGVAPSHGRSPVVVLREAEEALRQAREAGPESIYCPANCPKPKPAPAAFLNPAASDDFLAW
jgi:diguanylate cyclase (GGDEF)-like protein